MVADLNNFLSNDYKTVSDFALVLKNRFLSIDCPISHEQTDIILFDKWIFLLVKKNIMKICLFYLYLLAYNTFIFESLEYANTT